ncbi:hypothetical protein P12x_005376 [Tundrisphaera lichenicola]|uniref:hypothetical protein n=1 Tax=Tundrisphaera lichenicola TaxID=2029860 RepID=UPI003EB9586D
MSSQADVRSIEALKEFRAALALYAEETLGALGAVKMEARRTVQWVQQDRKAYWIDQIKRRRERVASARSEVARRRLAKTPEHNPAMSEQKELLRVAEASLREAEAKAILVKKWEPMLQQAVLEFQASIRRISDLAAGDIPRAMHLLGRLVDALEAYTRTAPPTANLLGPESGFGPIAGAIFEESIAESAPVIVDSGGEGVADAPSEEPDPPA